MTQSTNCKCQIALTLAVIELEQPTLPAILCNGQWSRLWFIANPSLPLWNNIQEVKYPQDSRSEPKQNY